VDCIPYSIVIGALYSAWENAVLLLVDGIPQRKLQPCYLWKVSHLGKMQHCYWWIEFHLRKCSSAIDGLYPA